jgi:hypothetical protein
MRQIKQVEQARRRIGTEAHPQRRRNRFNLHVISIPDLETTMPSSAERINF